MRIVWTSSARADLEAIRKYVARDSQYYAARYVAGIVEAVDILDKHPEIGEVVFQFQTKQIRQLLFQSHRVFYHVQADRVFVLAVVHPARDLDSLEPKPWDIS